MPKAIKVSKVAEINENLSKAKSVFLTDFTGLTVEEVTRLRKEFRKANVKYLVVKNTLARISAKELGYDKIIPYLQGPTGIAIAFDDPVAPVRIIYDFRKDKEKPAIKAAWLEGQLLNRQEAEEIRNIPPREVLLAQLLGTMKAPLTNFVGGLQSLLTKLVLVINAIKDKKESQH